MTDTVTVNDSKNRSAIELPAEHVAPGLAITPAIDKDGQVVANRWALVHVPSGLRLCGWRSTCRTHVEEQVAHVTAVDVDWTTDAESLQRNYLAKDVCADLVVLPGPCDNDCGHDEAAA